MREIKFRIYEKKHKKYIKKPEQIRMNCSNGFLHGKHSDGNVEDWIAEQYTGLKDKNGVEIYEGDILSDDVDTDEGVIKSKIPVYWCEKTTTFRMDFSSKKDRTWSEPLYVELRDFDYEVTGSIHEQ